MNKKVIAKILFFCMMIMLVQWCVPVNDVYATECNYESEYDGNLNWQIRNSPPLENNQYYYNSSYNVNAGGSYGMPNCTTYVIGRVYEATGVKFKDLKGSGSGASGDAGQWFTNNKNNGIYPYSTDAYSPKVGAVVCYSGHVEIVEVIGNDSGGQYICVSESNYSGRDSGKETKRFNYKKIYLDALNASKTSNFVKCTFLEDNDGYDEENRSGSYGTFQGYIYTVDSVSSTPTIEYNSSRFKNLSTEYWTDTTAKIATTFPEESYDDMGFYFGTSNSISSMTKVSEKKDTSVTFPHVSPGNSYRLGEEYPGYGYKWWNPLTPGTTYYWAFYLKQGNTEYISTVQSFTTTGGGDTQAPVLGDGGAVSGDGKVTISGSVSDNVGVSYVGIEIYPAGRSDLKKTAECVASDGHYSFEFNISQFNNIIGDYVYKLHAIDTSGNLSAVSTATIYIPGIELKGISLNKTSLALEKSESEKLTVTYNPDNTTDVKTVTWTSSDTSVATVNSSGTVTGISHGTAIITAKVGNYTAKCEVEVDMRIKGISLNKANINLVVGESDELSVICNPSHLTNSAMVTWWSSSNESVATVSNFGGTVTAIAPGTAIITAKIATGHTATCTVTVTAASTTSKLNTPQNPTFTWTPWFVISYDKVDNASGYSIILYKDGSEIRNIDNISITEYTCADILEQYGSGGYTFKVRANGTGSFTNSDWATSGTFNYTVPNQKYGMVDGVKWKDGVLSWNPVENAGKYTAYRITLCDATTNKGITMFKTLNCEIDLSKRMEVGKTYYARIYVESQNINKIASGDGYAKSSNYTYGQITTNSTPVEGFVERMYTVALNRPFDATGKANWVAALNAGTHDGAAIAKEFISGQEFALRNLSNEEYIETLYETFFDRASDASGKSNWLNHLAVGYSREFVLANFVNSEEFTNLCQSFGVGRGVMKDNGTTVNPGVPKFVDRLYSTVMGRKADWQGYTNWTMALAAKQQSAEQVAKSFFTSQEYLNKDTNNTTFITDLYRTFFDREPDSSGMANWKNCLNSGMTRNTVIAEFAKSAEFKAIAASYGLE